MEFIRRRNRDTVTYTNVVESSNDLVRILTVSDNHECNDEWRKRREETKSL